MLIYLKNIHEMNDFTVSSLHTLSVILKIMKKKPAVYDKLPNFYWDFRQLKIATLP